MAFQSGVTHAPRLSLIEAHKVVYLLQPSGLELGHRFEPHLYGPFSADLNRAWDRVSQVATWSLRKGKMFSVGDIGAALTRLSQAALVSA